MPSVRRSFKKTDALSTFVLIYNTRTDNANKPDVSVEYDFYMKDGGSEKFFNRTSSLGWNAQTLPREFDLAAGHQLQSNHSVALVSFPDGEYRLHITITYRRASTSVTRDVMFVVAGP